MKFSGVATIGGLLGAASAYSPPPSCAPTTVTQTVTVTAPYKNDYPQTYAPVTYGGSTYKAPPYVTTAGPTVTSVDYGYSKTSVWVYPTGNAPSKDCVVAIYEETKVTVIIINISITIINGQTTTIYSTVTGAQPTSTPGNPPPPPPPTTTYLPPPPTTTYSPPPPPTTTGAIHTVVVGGDGKLIYKDNQVYAAIGDIVRFQFNSTNHTLTQSSLQEPCTPLKGGFDTGFTHFNNASRADFLPPLDFPITVSTPQWFYCAQKKPTPHCQAGMVLGINPAGKFDEFISRATASATSIPITTGTGATSIAAPTGTGAYYPSGPKAYPSKRAAGYWAA